MIIKVKKLIEEARKLITSENSSYMCNAIGESIKEINKDEEYSYKDKVVKYYLCKKLREIFYYNGTKIAFEYCIIEGNKIPLYEEDNETELPTFYETKMLTLTKFIEYFKDKLNNGIEQIQIDKL